MVSIAMIKHHDQKATWRGKGLFDLHFPIAFERKSGQDLKQNGNGEAGAKASAMKKKMSLTGLLHMACFV